MEINLCEAERQHQLKSSPALSRLVACFFKGCFIENICKYFGYWGTERHTLTEH